MGICSQMIRGHFGMWEAIIIDFNGVTSAATVSAGCCATAPLSTGTRASNRCPLPPACTVAGTRPPGPSTHTLAAPATLPRTSAYPGTSRDLYWFSPKSSAV